MANEATKTGATAGTEKKGAGKRKYRVLKHQPKSKPGTAGENSGGDKDSWWEVGRASAATRLEAIKECTKIEGEEGHAEGLYIAITDSQFENATPIKNKATVQTSFV